MSQVIISISREYGSGGREIAEKLSERFGIAYYDKNILDHIAEDKEADSEELKKYDEKSANPLFYRNVMGYSNSPHDNIALMQFEKMQDMAKNGESFVILGRCSEDILSGTPGFVAIFVNGDSPDKIKRIAERNGLGEEEAEKRMKKISRDRRRYHNRYCGTKWGDSRNYDITVNSSRLGIDKTVDVLEYFIREKCNLPK